MEIKHLRLVRNIVELGSLSRAKDRLCLTQSALSHQLKDAELQAGTPLFIRSNKRLVLTTAGEKVYRTALEVLSKMDDLDQDIRELAQGGQGRIRICTACYTNYTWLPGLIRRFGEIHPQVEIRVHPEFINDPVARLLDHELDAVIINRPDMETKIRFFELMNDELVALVPPGHPWTGKRYVQAADFRGQNLIVFSRPMHTVVVYQKVLQPNGIEPEHIYEVPMSEAMVEMVAAHLGVAVIPGWIARPYVDAGKVVPVRVTPKGLYRSLGLAVLRRDTYPDYYQTLIGFLKESLVEKSRCSVS